MQSQRGLKNHFFHRHYLTTNEPFDVIVLLCYSFNCMHVSIQLLAAIQINQLIKMTSLSVTSARHYVVLLRCITVCCVQCAKAGARCDYGLYLAGTLDNASTVCKLASEAIALKMYLNETFASLKMDNMMQWMEV